MDLQFPSGACLRTLGEHTGVNFLAGPYLTGLKRTAKQSVTKYLQSARIWQVRQTNWRVHAHPQPNVLVRCECVDNGCFSSPDINIYKRFLAQRPPQSLLSSYDRSMLVGKKSPGFFSSANVPAVKPLRPVVRVVSLGMSWDRGLSLSSLAWCLDRRTSDSCVKNLWSWRII